MNATDRCQVQELSEEDYRKAFVEVAFLLDAFASTIDNIMGGNTTPVGRIAGRDTARKLPVELHPGASAEDVMAMLAGRMGAGFEFCHSGEELVFSRCVIRDLCSIRNIDAGGAVCRLFHAYFDGIVNGLLSRPVKSTIISTGETCRLATAVQ